MIELRRDDARYPALLRDLRGGPEPLWVDGDVAALAGDTVSIVGTRRMTPYGERVARELGRAAALAGRVVVSGLAPGIDSAAHLGALEGGGLSVAVLGEGLRAFSPHGRRRRLAARLRECGCLVSQFPPLASARAWTFASRDEVIAALGGCTVVVEAPAGSGALITARAALALGRPVHAVPGPLGSFASVGTNELIASGAARAITGPASLGLAGVAVAADPALDRLAARPLSPDESGLTAAEIAELVVSGRATVLPDGRIARAR